MLFIFQLGGSVLLAALCVACAATSINLPQRAATPAPASFASALTRAASPPPITAPVSTASPLPDLPLVRGNRWIYTSMRYEGYEGPNRLAATYLITEEVVETQVRPPYFVAQIHYEQRLVTASPGWSGSEEWVEDYWRIISGTHVYRQRLRLDLSDQDTFQLEYVFPLSVAASWCPGKGLPGQDCVASGKRTVNQVGARTVPAGHFEPCFEISEDFNTGVYRHWFCLGVGVVETQADHSGFPFGYLDKLLELHLRPP